MGARSSQSRGPGLNKTDGHLIEYFRNDFGSGGGSPGLVVQYVSPVSYMLIGGGGAGGLDMSGGGGAGGLMTGTTSTDFAIGYDYALTVGAGGAQADDPGVYGTSGNDSSCGHENGEFRAGGGGRGGGQPPSLPASGFAGGCGGGGAGGGTDPKDGGAANKYPSLPTTPAPLRGQTTTPSSQGYAGGNGYSSGSGAGGTYWGAGGGGTGAASPDAPSTQGGVGGAGATIPAPLGGEQIGGGGGGCGGVYPPGTGGAGGAGGGGAGSFANGVAGTQNTGGGGGGNGHVGTTGDTSGAGGSGKIKLLYPNAFTISNPGGGITMSTSTPGSNKLTTITAGTGNIKFS